MATTSAATSFKIRDANVGQRRFLRICKLTAASLVAWVLPDTWLLKMVMISGGMGMALAGPSF